ncbi:MAG: SMC-Scp complex subunit ScpB [Candidatus Magasanikbacteria bacterium RIFOXYC2_FULL_40_16]|uniref:SMC-Scp complex subunit ScpB n=3 Tax=Candidatus Magasanikiibacteriota TaxID=1752731 RepID=A0A1F6NHE3_9BACT|nr:MAG: SMC-Scp complex subunit ScpB [Candidatus Magasanikbacteria bacterium RIFOXYA2_FULL_40_20]OGH83242.1 MAG: SMC-Scp complex subunit ScpB [Candidatus Magasanikbacteria bacterium RIFOXYB1_FULL_40_15]OGH86466.1 MAG: SMC-Scp complex subunit ScpB [Candidatus Magasanikbacteria bacterium RIFOXYB2_FULL_40_13]OGH87061.1 MAG: SMC-Scp complex subunit ScpB [Candidatus Magasanikbacteria bacterium RIFOXYA1_FULL_40_8]OGH89525.1 MAG: SMC-Scp complex subunit ScpB [Candidatus Magasanikbacteria bacterium RIF
MDLQSQIESILFVASKPLKFSVIAKAVGVGVGEVEEVIEVLKMKYNNDSGINILQLGDSAQMATNPKNVDVIEGFMKDEIAGELTKAQLETLTVIAYRQPITRPELEVIRGVNCALIIRNLLMRGLIEELEDEEKIVPVYRLSFEALRHLGISDVKELPDYAGMSEHEYIKQVIEGEK